MQLTAEYIKFIELHEQQLSLSVVPQHFWKTLYNKITQSIFNIGDDFTLLKVDYDEDKNPEDPVFIIQATNENGIDCKDEEHIYLVDHAWTFRTENIRDHLNNVEALLIRMCDLMGIDKNKTKDEKMDEVNKSMWKYCQTYTIGNAVTIEDRLPVWYIMDEVGTAIIHSDEPNFRSVPFVYLPDKITYTIIFPIKNLGYGEFVTRDYAEGVTDVEMRKVFLLPWQPNSFLDIDYQQSEPNKEYFLSGHIEETLPLNTEDKSFDLTQPLKVFTEYNLISQHLTRKEFIITDDENFADIFWFTNHFKNYADLNVDKYINQFPFENVLTIKDLLCIVGRRKSINSNYPKWLPITYNLKTELNKFISYYQKRNVENADNHWILKPWNLARGLDTHITPNLDYILRLASTGPPKIAQKYIEDPVLFFREEIDGKVKFDVRYVILLKSIQPLKVYIYHNFFLRFSNKPFELKEFFDYEKHFTVMNYNAKVELKRMLCDEFIEKWEEQYPNFPWQNVERDILMALREIFEAAIMLPAPRGIAPSPSSRALYAADIMVEWDRTGSEPKIQPKLLEINWTPDCQRACDYYPDFYNKIFGLLFLNEEDEMFTEL